MGLCGSMSAACVQCVCVSFCVAQRRAASVDHTRRRNCSTIRMVFCGHFRRQGTAQSGLRWMMSTKATELPNSLPVATCSVGYIGCGRRATTTRSPRPHSHDCAQSVRWFQHAFKLALDRFTQTSQPTSQWGRTRAGGAAWASQSRFVRWIRVCKTARARSGHTTTTFHRERC